MATVWMVGTSVASCPLDVALARLFSASLPAGPSRPLVCSLVASRLPIAVAWVWATDGDEGELDPGGLDECPDAPGPLFLAPSTAYATAAAATASATVAMSTPASRPRDRRRGCTGCCRYCGHAPVPWPLGPCPPW